MKVIVAGSRTILKYPVVEECILDAIKKNNLFISEIVSGRAKGPDLLGETWALKNGVKISAFPADWKKYGISAGFIRNQEMADYADALIAIWDGQSNGTLDMIERAKEKNIPIFVYIRS